MAFNAPAAPSFYQSSIGSPFHPQAPYSQNQIQQTTNRDLAMEQTNNSMPALLKGTMRPSSGIASTSPAWQSRALGGFGQSLANQNTIRAMDPLQMQQANASSMLGQQGAQEGSALQTAGLFGQGQNMQFNQGLQGLQNGSQLLQMLGFGGFM